MNEGSGEFPSPAPTRSEGEQTDVSELDQRYDALVSDRSKEIFTNAGIDTGVKAVLGRSLEAQPNAEGELPDEDKNYFDNALGGLYAKIDESDLDDPQKESAREALTRFVSKAPIEGIGTLDKALGYEEEEPFVPGDNGELSPEARVRGREMLKAAGFREDDQRLDVLLNDLDSLRGKGELTKEQAEAISQRWSAMNIRKSEASDLLDGIGMSEEDQKKVLDAMTEKTQEEISEEEIVQGEADNISKATEEELAEARRALDGVPDGPQKENMQAMLSRLYLRLEELKVRKVGRGLVKGAVIALIALWVLFIGYLSLINKGAKKRS